MFFISRKILIPSLAFFLVSAVSAESQHAIEIKKFKFIPPEITVHINDSVRWTNKEKRQYHSVWFKQSGALEPDYFFPDEFFEKTFNQAGDFSYRCGPHPKMTGIVHVINKTSSAKKQKKNTRDITYLVKSIEDGDTIVIDYRGKEQRVQLIGINAPESVQNPKLNLDSKQKHIDKPTLLEIGKLSTQHLKTLLKVGQTVTLKGNLTQKDKYNRLPAIVLNKKGQSINQLMVEDGYALLLTRFTITDRLLKALKNAQQQAKSSLSGLWGSHSNVMKKWSE